MELFCKENDLRQYERIYDRKALMIKLRFTKND